MYASLVLVLVLLVNMFQVVWSAQHMAPTHKGVCRICGQKAHARHADSSAECMPLGQDTHAVLWRFDCVPAGHFAQFVALALECVPRVVRV